jgi:hypothetical protein
MNEKLHKELLWGMTSMMFQILGFLSVRCLKYAYQIRFCLNCNTLLKFFEMIKIILSFSCEKIWMYPLFVCDLEGCIYDVEHKYILILKPPFNLSIFKRLLVAHKDHIWLSRTTPYTNQSNKDLGFVA